MMCPSHPRARNVRLDRTACETLLPVQWSPSGATIQARETSRAEHRPVITLTRQRVELGIQVFHSGCDWNVRSPLLSSTRDHRRAGEAGRRRRGLAFGLWAELSRGTTVSGALLSVTTALTRRGGSGAMWWWPRSTTSGSFLRA